MKRYSNINVYDAAKKRIEYIFDEFETIAVSFSGGKDSGVVTWTWWEEGKEDIWVREMPKNEWVINLSNHKFEFYKPGMSFEKFTPLLNEWLAKTGSAAILLGLRAEESLNRYRAINDNKSTYKGLQWSTQINKAYANCNIKCDKILITNLYV